MQVFKQYLDATALHQRIDGIECDVDGLRQAPSARTLQRRLEGRELESSRRHGKHLFVELSDDGWLRLHFGMTGRLRYWKQRENTEPPEHTRLRLDLADGYRLAYVNSRQFGEVGLVDDPAEFIHEEGLGQDALPPGPDELRELLADRRGMIKTALMDQGLLAGLGNIYTDEVLFQARLHPETPVADLTPEQVERIHSCIHSVFEAAVGARVEPARFPEGYLLPRRQPGATCPRCGARLEKLQVGSRPTWICPEEQAR